MLLPPHVSSVHCSKVQSEILGVTFAGYFTFAATRQNRYGWFVASADFALNFVTVSSRLQVPLLVQVGSFGEIDNYRNIRCVFGRRWTC